MAISVQKHNEMVQAQTKVIPETTEREQTTSTMVDDREQQRSLKMVSQQSTVLFRQRE